MTTQRKASMSDSELKAALRGLREDVAAPQAFSAQVLQRLQKSGLITDAPSSVTSSAWLRLPVLRWGLGVSAALGLALVWIVQPEPVEAPVTALAPAPAPASSPALRGPHKAAAAASGQARHQTKAQAQPQMAQAPVPAAEVVPLPEAVAASQEAEVQAETVAVAQPQAAVGGLESAPALSSAHAAAGSATTAPMPSFAAGGASVAAAAPGQAAPAGLNDPLEPTPTPLPLKVSSELRNNVMRASRGEKARLLFRLGQGGQVRIDIHDRLGARMAVLHDGPLGPGEYGSDGRFSWNGLDEQGQAAPSGIYELRLVAPDLVARHKLVLVR